jgi:hypothetical protein
MVAAAVEMVAAVKSVGVLFAQGVMPLTTWSSEH